MSKVCILNDSNFDKCMADKRGIAAILFWTPWCGHCGSSIPVFEELSEEMTEVTFVTVNKDESANIAGRYGIGSVPYIVFLKDGTVLEIHQGAMDKEKLRLKLYYF